MDWFEYRDGQLFCEEVNVDELASQVGTPFYLYSRKTLEHHYDAITAAFAELNPLVCYSIKSCGNINIIKLLSDRGSGMDIVSGGELYRAQQAGVSASKIFYAGVGKTDEEIRAALEIQIGCFNIESGAEFENISRIAASMDTTSTAALRVNPDVDPNTHKKTTTGVKETKFGVDIDRAVRFFKKYGKDERIKLSGIHLHLGSPIYSVEPYVQAIKKTLQLIEQLKSDDIQITTLNIGGGYGADYETGQTPHYDQYAQQIVPLLKPFADAGGRIILEPGRTIACNAGLLVARVQYVKMGGSKKFIILDSGMSHLIRPAMYDSFHFVWPASVAPNHEPASRLAAMPNEGLEPCDIVGPICESGDCFAKDRHIPPVARGDLIAIFSAGAYGMSMASNYNAYPRPAEILVEGDKASIIRTRETYGDLVAGELEPKPV